MPQHLTHRACRLAALLLPALLLGCQTGSSGGGRSAAASRGDADLAAGRGDSSAALSNRRADPAAGINSGNAESLKPAWEIATEANVSHTPLVHDGRVYFGDWSGKVHAADLATGERVWEKQIEQKPMTKWPWHGFAGTGAIGGGMLFEASAEGNAYGIDLGSGEVKWQTRFVEQGQEAGNAGTMLYHDGLVYIGVCSVEEALTKQNPKFKPDFRGKVVALRAADGKVAWERPLAEPPATGVAVWSAFALDPRANTLFVTTSNNYTKPPTGASDAFIALDARSGKIRWVTQVTANDVWTMANPIGPDYAFGGGPQLFETTVNGKARRLVGGGQKSGVYYALDRDTGKIVWTSVIGYGGFGGGIHGEAAVGEGRVFVQSNNNFDPMKDDPTKNKANVKAIDAATGAYVWSLPQAKPAATHSGDFLSADVFLTGALDGKVRAYAAADGSLLWTSPAHGSNASALAVHGDTLLFGTGLPKMLAGNGGRTGVFAYRPAGGGRARTASARDRSADAGGDAPGEGRRTVEVVAVDYRYEPARIEAAPGEPLAVKLINRGSHPHNIEFELPGGEQELEEPVPTGESAVLKFDAPQEPGEYTVYCPVADHKERGMVGTLVVRRRQ